MIRHPHYLELPWQMHWHPTVEHRHLWLIMLLVLLVMLMIGVGVATGLI